MERFFSIVTLIFSLSVFAETASMQAKVVLRPAGSFVAETDKVKGEAVKTPDGGVSAENIVIDLRTLHTGVGLRDKHLKDKIQVEKYPETKLVKATGKNGKGIAEIEFMGMKKKVEGTYKIEGKSLNAEFPINLPDFNITGIKYMGIGVKDEVVIAVKVPLNQQIERRAASQSGG